MAKKDFLSVFVLDKNKQAKEDLKEARKKEMEEVRGVRFQSQSINRAYEVYDAMRLGVKEDSIFNLMTPTAQKKFTENSKPL